MSEIKSVHAREILDSRGFPTIEVDIKLSDNSCGRASVPSGASTGSQEAVELRDQDSKRYKGKGVLNAVKSVNGEIADAINGMSAFKQQEIDNLLIELDGTHNKARLGANAILAVSIAVAKAAAMSSNASFYKYLGGDSARLMPVPLMNIINGGAHADNNIDIQEFMIVPVNAYTMADAVRMGAEVFHSLKAILKKSGFNTNVGDEGGFAPALETSKQALEFICNAIIDAGYQPGKDIIIALDAAANEFYHDGKYHLTGEGSFSSEQLVNYYAGLIDQFPIISIEDPMAEYDMSGWKLITDELGKKIQLVGDDLFVTNPAILQEGIKQGLANSILIKPNQIGSLTEVIATINLARSAGYNTIISHRSGETEDSSIAHLAVAFNAGQIKTGSLARSERLAKYNELIRIEEELGGSSEYANDRFFKKTIF